MYITVIHLPNRVIYQNGNTLWHSFEYNFYIYYTSIYMLNSRNLRESILWGLFHMWYKRVGVAIMSHVGSANQLFVCIDYDNAFPSKVINPRQNLVSPPFYCTPWYVLILKKVGDLLQYKE